MHPKIIFACTNHSPHMGKGDKKSKKGKLWLGSRGKKRAARSQNKKTLLRNNK